MLRRERVAAVSGDRRSAGWGEARVALLVATGGGGSLRGALNVDPHVRAVGGVEGEAEDLDRGGPRYDQSRRWRRAPNGREQSMLERWRRMQRMRARRPGSAGAGPRLDIEQVMEREERLDQVRHGVLRKAR